MKVLHFVLIIENILIGGCNFLKSVVIISMKMSCECHEKARISRGDCCKKTLPHPEFGEFLCSCLHGDMKNGLEDNDSLPDHVV